MVKKNRTTGKWYVRYYVKNEAGKNIQKRKDGFASKEAAQRFEVDHKDLTLSSGKTMTFEEMFEAMSLHNRASEVTTGTRRERLKKYAADLWSSPMRLLTKPKLEAWRLTLEETDLKATTKNDTINYVKQVFKYGYNVYDTYDSAKILQPFEKSLDEYHEYHIITFEQFQLLLAQDSNAECRDIFRAMYMLGCRKGEARALYKSDYDPSTKQIHITKAMRRYVSSLKTPKTAGSVRYVPVDDQTAALFDRLRQRKGKWMFGDYTPVSLTMLQDHFKADLKAAGLSSEIRIHDLRHSHVSLLWAAGVPIPEISKRIGHSSPAQTMKTYSHIFDNKQSASLNVLNNLARKAAPDWQK